MPKRNNEKNEDDIESSNLIKENVLPEPCRRKSSRLSAIKNEKKSTEIEETNEINNEAKIKNSDDLKNNILKGLAISKCGKNKNNNDNKIIGIKSNQCNQVNQQTTTTTKIKSKSKCVKPIRVERTPQSVDADKDGLLFGLNPTIHDILLAVEGKDIIKPPPVIGNEEDDDDNDDDSLGTDDESDWEEVKNDIFNMEENHLKATVSDVDLNVEDIKGILNKKKSKLSKAMEWAKYWFDKYRRDSFVWLHKVHLLTLIGHGMYVNKILNGEFFKAIAYSLYNVNVLKLKKNYHTKCNLETFKIFIDNLITILPSLNLNGSQLENYTTTIERLENAFKNGYICEKIDYIYMCVGVLKGIGFEVRLILSLYPIHFKEKIPKCHKQAKTFISSTTTCENLQKRKNLKNLEPKIPKKKTRKGKNPKNKITTQEEMRPPSCSKYFVDSSKGKTVEKKVTKKIIKVLSSSSDDDDYDEKKHDNKNNNCMDAWCEVYLAKEKKWITIDFLHESNKLINDDDVINMEKNRCSNTIRYVLAFNERDDDNIYSFKDLTEKYASKFNVNNRKLRADHNWWKCCLEIFAGRIKNTARDRLEDEFLLKTKRDLPMPKSINEFKNHSLYVLKRHLLKFQAIYPHDVQPLGFIRNEAIYGREHVYTLHTRETWLRSGRQVKLNEIPYKIVKARKNKKDVYMENPMADIFGLWQTEAYVPDPVKDGKIPRNEYGNVELYKPEMLPKGGAHLRLSGLNKVAKNLDIDCAPAVVGWDFHGGFNHPVFDGFVIPEECREILISAWNQEQEIIAEKQFEKRQKRVYDRWKLLIKGLLIRRNLRNKYAASNFD